jgi:very-short-patch-repair endonuclease
MTVSEQRLWNWLRNRTFGGFKFRRQAPVGRYVLDFYCPALRLAIEVDGQHHETQGMAEYDGERSRYLQSQGIEVVRIANKLLASDSLMAEDILHHAIAKRCAR